MEEPKAIKYEVINPSEHLLSWIHLHSDIDAQVIAPHWHRSIELSYTSAGKIDSFKIGQEDFETQTGMILVVNSQEVHSIRVDKKAHCDQEGLTITFPYQFVRSQFSKIDDYYIDINHPDSLTRKQLTYYRKLQKKLAKVVALEKQETTFKELRLNILVLEVLDILLEQFLKERKEVPDTKLAYAERVHLITNYVQEHFRDKISLEDVASVCFLSKNYAARFIKQHMGVTLGEYVNIVRAQNAYQDLLESRKNFTEIAMSNGFSGLRSMNRALIKQYDKNARQIRADKE